VGSQNRLGHHAQSREASLAGLAKGLRRRLKPLGKFQAGVAVARGQLVEVTARGLRPFGKELLLKGGRRRHPFVKVGHHLPTVTSTVGCGSSQGPAYLC